MVPPKRRVGRERLHAQSDRLVGSRVFVRERDGADEDVGASLRVQAHRAADHGGVRPHGAHPFGGREVGVGAVVFVVEPDDRRLGRRLVLRHVAKKRVLQLQRLPSAVGVAGDPVPDEGGAAEDGDLVGRVPVVQHDPVVEPVEAQQALRLVDHGLRADPAEVVADHEERIRLPAHNDVQIHRAGLLRLAIAR